MASTRSPEAANSSPNEWRETAIRPDLRLPSSGRRRRLRCCRLHESKKDTTIGPRDTRASSRNMLMRSTGVAMCCSNRMQSAPAKASSPKGKACTLAHARRPWSLAAATMFGSRSTSTARPGTSSERRPAPQGTSSQGPSGTGVFRSKLTIALRSRASVRDPVPVWNLRSR
jgi:hypothetical protein